MNINYFKITKENAIEFVALKTLFLILSILMIVLTLSVIVAGVRGTAWEYHVTNDTAGETNITYHSAIENYGMVDVTFSLWIWVLVVTVFIMIVALIYQVLKMVSK
ncbi:hypothetical protein J7J18_04480 [bacterium]|nr:hypothetical protein [bacterium]